MPRSRPSLPALFLSPLASIFYLLLRPRLLALAICPVLLNLLVFAVVFSALYFGLVGPWAGAVEIGMAEALDGVLRFLLQLVVVALTLLVSGVFCYLLVSVIGSPFYDAISERVEKECLKSKPEALAPEQGFAEGVSHSMLEALRRLALALPVFLLLLGLAFVPVVGTVTALLLGFLKASFFLALDSFSYSLDRRRMTLSGKVRWLRARPRSTFGVGAGLAFLLFIPCGFIWFPPLAAVAATREFCRIQLAGE